MCIHKSMTELNKNSITFGKYRDQTLTEVLRDRSYSKWLLEQDWFLSNYEYLYNRIKEYNPLELLVRDIKSNGDFMNDYKFFNLKDINELEFEMSKTDIIMYEFYVSMINSFKNKIYERFENDEPNPYDIKAPSNWLKKFENQYGIPRAEFKEFIQAYDLPNIPYIIGDIKAEGGIEYKGAESFNIAKARSVSQENFWEVLLKEKYGEHLGTQFKLDNCIFDFININTRTIYECKLGLKDFDEPQYKKYKKALEEYNIIYLISNDCIINIGENNIYTTNTEKYTEYIKSIPQNRKRTKFDLVIYNYKIITIDSLLNKV